MKKVKQISLGDEVQDTVTGFRGIAIGSTQWLNGCTRIGVQAPKGKDGTIKDAMWFDEPQLKIVTAGKVKPGPRDTGGPMPSIPTQQKPG